MALAQAALGGGARVFLNGEAVRIIREPIAGWEDASYADAGLPTLPTLYEEALKAGVKIIVCQSGMQMTTASASDYDERVEYGGMVSLLRSVGDGRLVTV